MLKKKLLITSLATLLVSPVAVQGTVNATAGTEQSEIVMNQEHYVSFTNHDFYMTAKSLGYSLEEPLDDPNYNPEELNTIIPSSISVRDGSILDRQTVTLSADVVNSVKNVGAQAGAAILAVYLPGAWAAAPTIAAAIVSEIDVARPLQVTMVHQRTAYGSEWVVANYQWV